jgi:DUF971 family protein
MEHTTEHLCVIHDGARYHTRASTQAFLATHRERIPQQPLPSSAPDDHPTVTTQEVHPVRLSAVGNYALHIDWSDGHHTGIYPWDMLRALCPELRPAAPASS